MSIRIRQRVAASPLAAFAALPSRIATVGRHNARTLRVSATWILTSREHTNFTYNLTDLNREHLAWYIADLSGQPVARIREYISEIGNDDALRQHVRISTIGSKRSRLADAHARWHKRIGWYALLRATQPRHVVETGTDKGLGSIVLAAALLRNGRGRLTTLDTNSASGYLIGGRYAQVTDRLIGDSLSLLPTIQGVDLFLHDSLHTYEHELAEFEAVAPRLRAGAIVLSDNSHATRALPDWAESTGRRFTYWHECPEDHWYPGGGIGAAQPNPTMG